ELYRALAAADGALADWQRADADAGRQLTIRVDRERLAAAVAEADDRAAADEAATQLLALPWELVRDDEGYLCEGARGVRVRRALPHYKPRPALVTEAPIRVLLVSPRPEDEGTVYIDHRLSARPLVEALDALGELAELEILSPPTFPALKAGLRRARQEKKPFHVVHFDGHGVYDRRHGLGALCFEDPADAEKIDRRRSRIVDAAEIAEALRDFRVPLFFLEACQSARAEEDPTASVAARLLQG
ncbi:MAG: CHAT domain-containing protein, partial [Deltaproteobacteria bacterium]|nr:CHAT domain-containing protein [Deltaproteobacteria bacterium]